MTNKTFLEVLLNVLEEFFVFFLREGIDGAKQQSLPFLQVDGTIVRAVWWELFNFRGREYIEIVAVLLRDLAVCFAILRRE